MSSENSEIADWLIRLTANQRNWGFELCFLYLRNVKSYGWNHKRVYRIYRQLELNLRIKPKKRLLLATPVSVVIGYLIATYSFPGRRIVIWLSQAALSFPTVLIGLLLYIPRIGAKRFTLLKS